jgi:hypothetical protein
MAVRGLREGVVIGVEAAQGDSDTIAQNAEITFCTSQEANP